MSLPIFFQRNFSPWKRSVWTRRTQVSHPAEKFLTESRKNFAQCLKSLRKFLRFLRGNHFSTEFFYGQVKFSFDNPAEKIFDKKLKLIYYSSECFYGQVKCSFHNPVRKVSTKTPKICVKCSKMLEKSYFVLEKFFRENDRMDKWIAVSKSQLKNFGQKAGNFLFYGKKWYKTNFSRLLVDQRNAIDG